MNSEKIKKIYIFFLRGDPFLSFCALALLSLCSRCASPPPIYDTVLSTIGGISR